MKGMDHISILLLSVIGPIVGSALGVWRRPSHGFIHSMMAFAAGVMMAISFLQLIPDGLALSSPLVAVVGVVVGALAMVLLDRFIPHAHAKACGQRKSKLDRTAIYLVAGIFMHNIPEGMAVAMGLSSGLDVSLAVALAISIHNIPEGICTSAPYYYVTGRRWKSFLVSASTALPVMIGYLIALPLLDVLAPSALGFLMAATAGLMVYISADELIPVSCTKPGNGKAQILSLIFGVIFVMALLGI